MVDKDTRIQVYYNGHDVNDNIIFTNAATKKYILIKSSNIDGASILAIGTKYVVRVLPGEHYIVEGAT